MILEIIKQRHEQSDGKCGISLVSITEKTGKTWGETRQKLIKLVKSGCVKHRPGVNATLFFYNKPTNL